MKAVELLVNSMLPEDLQDPNRVYDKKGVAKLLADVATKYPERYSEIVKKLSDIGRFASYRQGETIGLKDLRPVVDKDTVLAQMDQEIEQAKATAKSPEDYRKKQMGIWARYAQDLEKATLEGVMNGNNNLGNIIISGARGNPFQLKAMLTTPSLYTDYKDDPIPLFVRRSYSEGLRPAEYLASTFGVRKGVISTKQATADAGDLSKQMVQSVADVNVTEEDCGVNNGIDFDADDPDIIGRVLQQETAGHPSGTVIDKHVFADIQRSKSGKAIVRSPLTCQAKSGICSKCMGTLPNGKFPPIGYSAGITAAQAIGEPIAQGGLNCLAEDTLVRTADNEHRPIQEINTGDWVMGVSTDGEPFPVQVLNKWDQGIQPVYRYWFVRNGCHIVLEATEKHPILSCSMADADWLVREIGHLQSGDLAIVVDDDPDLDPVQYWQFEFVEPLGQVQCWDLAVDSEESLFLLDSGLAVHNTKHGGGGFTGEKKEFAGMPVISQLVQSPETFPDKATVSSLRGKVTKIEEAPQGGNYVYVDGEPHYTLPGMDPQVAIGDEVEEGDQLSDGVVDPEDIMRYRGLGEARRYYIDRLQKAMADSGVGKPSELNLELLARGALDHVRINELEGMGDYLPDDIASYNRLANKHQANADARMESVDKAKDKYLQAPALHYTIGTRITPRMVQRLRGAGFKQLAISNNPPGFSPEMVRMRSSKHGPGDWLAKMNTSYLKGNLAEDAARAQDTDIEENYHFAPRLMYGKGFGKDVDETGKF